ncbi:hypothetical protein FOCC_FOCC002296 [Frankliniella occidentalis]|nr:hypothetical protein FOCC_FOCC002296 [Frankliniella occidentalis]
MMLFGVAGKSKGKLRRMVVPLLVFVLLKAMTLIPLALGVLGLKAWNALQLGFFSFVIALSLAVFQLCKKIAADQAPVSQLSAHVAPWDAHYAAARAFELPQGAAEAIQSVPQGVLPAQPVDVKSWYNSSCPVHVSPEFIFPAICNSKVKLPAPSE